MYSIIQRFRDKLNREETREEIPEPCFNNNVVMVPIPIENESSLEKIQDNGFDLGDPSAVSPFDCDMADLIIQQLCSYSNIKELMKYRLVSRAWNRVVLNQPRFLNNKVVFGKFWGKQAEVIDLDSITKWKYIWFYNFNFLKQQYLPKYWANVKDSVRKIQLDCCRIKCADFANLINSTTGLQLLELNEINFEPTDQLTDTAPAKQNNHHHVHNPQDVHVTFGAYCPHGENRLAFKSNEPLGKPTITTLLIKNQVIPLPFCVCTVLKARCRGSLNKFNYEKYPDAEQQEFSPNSQQIENQLTILLQDCQDSLKSFTWAHNSRYTSTTLPGNLATFPQIKLTELVLVEEKNDRQNNSPTIRGAILQLLQHPQLRRTLAVVHIGYRFDANFYNNQLGDLLPLLISLRKLKLSIEYHQDHYHFTIFEQLQHLEELVIEDSKYLKAHGRRPWQFRNHTNFQYFLHLPPRLRALTIGHYIDVEEINMQYQLLNSNELLMLTKLVLLHAKLFDDEAMQIVIRRLRYLEEFKVTNALRLTDSGVTGLELHAIGILLRCPNLSINGKPAVPRLEHSIMNLKHLKKLSFRYCSRLSDVSVRYGVVLPKLKSLDLTHCPLITDIGLVALGQNNPSLEVLYIQHNYHISHYGLHLLLQNHKVITKIYVSECALKRKTEQSSYPEHALFGDIVTADKPKIVND